ncbi:MAG: alanine racemase [Atopobiaceae bacterium]|nr:alanine racemase [Atopobiaceae bacterium]
MPLSHEPTDRWAWVEIDLNAIRKNTRAIKALLKRGTKLMCAVKADGYGHGAIECTKAMHASGADQFAVATVAEGVELREAGIEWPILLLNQVPMGAIDTLLEYDIMPSVYTSEFALAYGESAAAMDKIGKYHLAIDTGMTRIGVLPEDVLEFRHAIDFHRGLKCMGTFTHFATADNVQDWDFQLQARRFDEAVKALRDAGREVGLVHCDNTPGTILHPHHHFDMCRAGIGLYGLQPSEATAPRIKLVPAMSVRARVTRAIYPAVGEGVSYGLNYRVPTPHVQVATIPVGYADGLSRSLSGRMEVLVHGKRARQVGNICMDQCMFAVDTNPVRSYRRAQPVQEGDLVTIIGNDGNECITADEMAQLRGTINYEVTCNFGMRMEKVYV